MTGKKPSCMYIKLLVSGRQQEEAVRTCMHGTNESVDSIRCAMGVGSKDSSVSVYVSEARR